MSAGCWVFGYGSLVSPQSFGATLGRRLQPSVDFFEAELHGFGRRWNYGVMHTEGTTVAHDGSVRTWTIVALGVELAAGERVNGVVGWVEAAELPALDRRERHYDRVDVSSSVEVEVWGSGAEVAGPIFTYVPRPEARRHVDTAREAGRAAIDRRYWDLVDGAFADLGEDRRRRYHATTPDPELPVVAMERRPVR